MDGNNCIYNVFILSITFPHSLWSTAIASHRAEQLSQDLALGIPVRPGIFCRVPNSHSVDASALPPNPNTHRRIYAKPYKAF